MSKLKLFVSPDESNGIAMMMLSENIFVLIFLYGEDANAWLFPYETAIL